MEDSDDDIPLVCRRFGFSRLARARRTATLTTNQGGDTTSTAIAEADEVRNRAQNQRTEAEEGAVSTPVGNGKSVCMTLSDPDLLDCPICFFPLCSPVYQCENGHMACASCCTSVMKNKCSSCSLPIGNIRCRPIEKVIGSIKLSCQYNAFGCAELLSRSKKVAHEKTCKYVPCSCPSIGCNFVGSSKHLYDHFALEHKDLSQQFNFGTVISIKMKSADKHVILQERSEGELFVVNRCIETFGSLFNVIGVAPPSSERRWYELTAFVKEDNIEVGSYVDMMSKWAEHTRPTKTSIAVSSNFISTTQLLRLKVVIRKDPGPRRYYFG